MNKIDDICDAIELVPGLICSYDNNIHGTVMKKRWICDAIDQYINLVTIYTIHKSSVSIHLIYCQEGMSTLISATDPSCPIYCNCNRCSYLL